MERTWAKLTDELIEKALIEDVGRGDVTTKSIVPARLVSTGLLFNKTTGVLAGIDVSKKIFHKIDPKLEFSMFCKDGDLIDQGQKMAEIPGSVK